MTERPKDAKGRYARAKPAPAADRTDLRYGLAAGKLPKDSAHVETACNRFRRQLEDAVLAARGRVTLSDAANIQTALKWERHSALALRYLRLAKGLTPAECLRFSEAIAKASTERDRAVRALDLDTGANQDLFAALGNGGSDE